MREAQELGVKCRLLLPAEVTQGQTPAPKRLVLSPDAFTVIQKALTNRLAKLQSQRDVAFSTNLQAQILIVVKILSVFERDCPN
jgi:hypothetical protein